MQAALLRVNCSYLDADVAGAAAWRAAIATASAIRRSVCRTVACEEQHAWHLFVVRCARRDALQGHLQARGIQTLVHYPVPAHRQPAYPSLHSRLPLTERMRERSAEPADGADPGR